MDAAAASSQASVPLTAVARRLPGLEWLRRHLAPSKYTHVPQHTDEPMPACEERGDRSEGDEGSGRGRGGEGGEQGGLELDNEWTKAYAEAYAAALQTFDDESIVGTDGTGAGSLQSVVRSDAMAGRNERELVAACSDDAEDYTAAPRTSKATGRPAAEKTPSRASSGPMLQGTAERSLPAPVAPQRAKASTAPRFEFEFN